MARKHQIRLAWPALAAIVALVGGCSLVAKVDRNKVTENGSGPAETGAEGGTGGAEGTGGSSSTAGAAGSGGGAICSSPEDCPGEDTACQTRTCTNGTCGIRYELNGKAIATQNEGDCTKVVCDGQGAETTEADDSDVPTNDNDCVVVVCSSGTVSIENVDEGESCSSSNGTVCDSAGACVECVVPSNCSGGHQTCVENICVAESCANGKRDKGETDVDCGGTDCIPCEDGMTCGTNDDCKSGTCDTNATETCI